MAHINLSPQWAAVSARALFVSLQGCAGTKWQGWEPNSHFKANLALKCWHVDTQWRWEESLSSQIQWMRKLLYPPFQHLSILLQRWDYEAEVHLI